jgi:cyclophilin family peptidyl-prolyl cis-trans isomerase
MQSSVLLETDVGVLVVDLFDCQHTSLVENFLRLCESSYFRNTLVHSVQKDFCAGLGDPTGTGKGGESFVSLVGSAPLPPSVPQKEERFWQGRTFVRVVLYE